MVEKNNGKLNTGVLVFTIVALLGVVIYFAVFNKDDVPVSNITTKVYVETVELDKTTLTISIGEKETLKAKITPSDATNKNVSWISNNDTVVTVDDNGNIFGVSVGKATITVKTEDGKRTSSCVVNVIDPDKPVVENVVDVVGVSLNNTEMALLKGSSYKLIATVKPNDATNKNISWTSSDPSVATVDENGNVKTIELGKTTITVKTKDGAKIATCHITVMDKSIPVTGVVLNKLELSLIKGTSETINMTILPNNATNNIVTWSSSNPSVATVDSNGKITGVSAGKATITVKTKDGNKTAKCVVTVNNLLIDVEEINLDLEELTMTVGSNKTIKATITPSNATYKNIAWTSSNPDVVKVDRDGKVTAVGLGKSIITAKTTSGNKTAKCEITVTN